MKPKHQKFWVIGIASLTILSSILATLWTQGFFSRRQPDRQSYQNITFTDAVLRCESTTRSQYKKLLQNLTLDDLSSRFDHAENLYRIFFNADIANSHKNSETADVYISCSIDAQKGHIASYEVIERKESKSEPVRREKGGLFGWPLD